MKTEETNPSIARILVKTDLALPDQAIKEGEVCSLLSNEFPAMIPVLKQEERTNVYQALRCLVMLTRQLAIVKNIREVKHCFNVAEKMLKEGNATVRNAVENVYVYSLTPLLDCSPLRDKLRALLNDSLRCEYERQVRACGI